MTRKRICRICITLVMAVAALLSVASAAENDISTHTAGAIWSVSSSKTTSRVQYPKNGTSQYAHSNCEHFAGATTVNGHSSIVSVTYQQFDSTTYAYNNISNSGVTGFSTVTGKTAGKLFRSIPANSPVYGYYRLSYSGSSTTASGYNMG